MGAFTKDATPGLLWSLPAALLLLLPATAQGRGDKEGPEGCEQRRGIPAVWLQGLVGVPGSKHEDLPRLTEAMGTEHVTWS